MRVYNPDGSVTDYSPLGDDNNLTLDVALLLEQGQKISVLKDEYDSMFQSITSVLNEMNEGWSENLSNNFTTKIAVAQKGFAKIVEMLECGAVTAKEAAQSFEDINTVMSRTMTGGFADLFTDVVGYTPEQIWGALTDPQMWQGVWEDMQTTDGWRRWVEGFTNVGGVYGDLAALEQELFGTGVLSTASGIIDGIGSVTTEFLDVFDGKNEWYNAYEESMTTTVVDAIVEGNYVQAGVGTLLYTTEAATGFVVDAAFGGVEAILEGSGIMDILPVDTIENLTGIDLDSAIPAVADGIKDGVSDIIDMSVEGWGYLEDAAQEGLSYIGDLFEGAGTAISGWFN